MAKAIGLDFVMLAVRDLDAAKHFYLDLLRLEEDTRFTNPTAITFIPAPIPFGVRAAGPEEAMPSGEEASQAITLWIQCDDADALHSALAAEGVPILQPPHDTPFGRRFICRDPNGYALILYKAIPLDQVRVKP